MCQVYDAQVLFWHMHLSRTVKAFTFERLGIASYHRARFSLIDLFLSNLCHLVAQMAVKLALLIAAVEESNINYAFNKLVH